MELLEHKFDKNKNSVREEILKYQVVSEQGLESLSARIDKVHKQLEHNHDRLASRLLSLSPSNHSHDIETKKHDRGHRMDRKMAEDIDTVQDSSKNEVFRQILQGLPKISEWPDFYGEGEYNHTEFISWIDTLKEDAGLPDTLLTSRLSIFFKGIASDWYRDRRNSVMIILIVLPW